MSPPPPATSRHWGGLGAGATVMGACLVCCAAPVISVLGGIAALSALAALWIPALAVLAVLAGAGGAWHRRRAAVRASRPDLVDLGMPARTPPVGESGGVSRPR